MEIVIGERQSGKTTKLIKRATKEHLYILVSTKTRAKQIKYMSNEMGVSILYPVTIDEFMRSGGFRGSWIRRDGLLIDDVDDVLAQIFAGIKIHEVTLTDYGDNIEYLGHAVVKNEE